MSAAPSTSAQSQQNTAEAAVKSENAVSTPPAEPQPKVKKRRLGVDPRLIISEERSKRRRTPSPEPEEDNRRTVHDPKNPERAKQLGLQIYGRIMGMNDLESVGSFSYK